ncbi:MAG: hypothetical protein KBF25_09945, partial [Chitinophagaceae bacterium]|nr:hypothetical protein [Chitinophagaceae bacterium]
MKDFSFVTHSHPAYIEEVYKDFVNDPTSVDTEWKKFFEGFDFAMTHGKNGHAAAITQTTGQDSAMPLSQEKLKKELAVYQLIKA